MEKSTKIIISMLSVSILFSLLMSQLTPKDDNLKENPIYLQIKQQEQKEQHEKEKKKLVEEMEEKKKERVKFIYFDQKTDEFDQKTDEMDSYKYNSYHKLCHGANYVKNVEYCSNLSYYCVSYKEVCYYYNKNK